MYDSICIYVDVAIIGQNMHLVKTDNSMLYWFVTVGSTSIHYAIFVMCVFLCVCEMLQHLCMAISSYIQFVRKIYLCRYCGNLAQYI